MGFSFRPKRLDPSTAARLLKLSSYTPSLPLSGLQTGIDNVRTDVYLSPKLVECTRAHLSKLIARFSGIEDSFFKTPGRAQMRGLKPDPKPEPLDFVPALAQLHLASLTNAKGQANVCVDILARLAVIKFLRSEIVSQFNVELEKLRAKLKQFEGPLQQNATATVRLRERIAKFQVDKKLILRKVGQELYLTLLDAEKGDLARMRRSLFGDSEEATYELLHNRLHFAESTRDDLVNAEHYVILGNYERDPDRLGPVMDLARSFLRSTGFVDEHDDDAANAMLSVPENADELFAGGNPDAATDKGRLQEQLLSEWTGLLEKEGIIANAIAAYEVPGLLGEYSPLINAQQIKQSLISRDERKRVCTFLQQHGRISEDHLYEAAVRVAGCKGADRSRIAARYFKDVIRYYRDVRRYDLVMAAIDGINLLTSEKLRELSAINHSLYEFLLPDEQKPAEAKVVSHIVLKADIRDSSLLTRTLFERGLNPASYFSLNFYEPINKLLDKYNATKLFIEGDAVILALFEREGEPAFGVARTCVMAREMMEIVRGYNQKSEEAGLPTLELGIGICYQDSAPMYLVDGTSQIMISPALNESDRLSSCSRSARKLFAGVESLFNVFCFQTIDDADTAGQPEEFLMRFNIGGINLQQGAFKKLSQEISLQPHDAPLPALWDEKTVRLYSGVVHLGPGMYHNLVVRESRIAHVDARDFHLKHWTDRYYYEVCTNPEIYEYVAAEASAVAAE